MTAYRLRPNVQWVVEKHTVTVTNGAGTVRSLQYPEAAVWDLFTRGQQFTKVVVMIGHIASLDSRDSEALVRASVWSWVDCGFLEQG